MRHEASVTGGTSREGQGGGGPRMGALRAAQASAAQAACRSCGHRARADKALRTRTHTHARTHTCTHARSQTHMHTPQVSKGRGDGPARPGPAQSSRHCSRPRSAPVPENLGLGCVVRAWAAPGGVACMASRLGACTSLSESCLSKSCLSESCYPSHACPSHNYPSYAYPSNAYPSHACTSGRSGPRK